MILLLVEKGQIYKHFKGNLYEIIAIAYDSENLKKLVVYKSLKDDKVWVRDYQMFTSLVDKKKYPNVEQVNRFELVK